MHTYNGHVHEVTLIKARKRQEWIYVPFGMEAKPKGAWMFSNKKLTPKVVIEPCVGPKIDPYVFTIMSTLLV